MHIASIGIDIGKTSFHLVALNEHGSIVIRKRFSRTALLGYTAQLTPSLIGMESSDGAHFLAWALRAQGHDARLMAAKFVKPFRKSNKNDYRDAEAIAEAFSRKNMRFVAIKTDEQPDMHVLLTLGLWAWARMEYQSFLHPGPVYDPRWEMWTDYVPSPLELAGP